MEQTDLSKKKFLLFGAIIFLAAVNMRPAITSVAPLLETIRAELGMSSYAASFLTSIPVLCMGIFAPVAAKLGSRWGYERVIALCLVVAGGATLARAVAHSSAYLLMTAVLVGVGVAIAGPLLSGLIKLHFPHAVALMIGIYSIGMGLGASLGAGLTIPFQRMLEDSWPAALAMWSILAPIALLLLLSRLGKRSSAAVRQTSAAGSGIPWTNRRAWLLLLFFALQAGIYYSIATWLAPMGQELGMNNAAAGAVVTTFALFQMLFSLIIPVMANGKSDRRPWLIGCSLAVLAGLLAVAAANAAIWIWLSAVLLGIGTAGLFSFALILPLDETSSSHEATAWTAMVQSGGYLLGGAIPVFSGWLRDLLGSYRYSFAGLIALCLALLFIACLRGPKRTGDAEQSAS